MNHNAIYALYPSVVTIDDTDGARDAQGNKVEIDMSAVNAWVNPEAYKYKRAPEYPPLTDLADALIAEADAVIAAPRNETNTGGAGAEKAKAAAHGTAAGCNEGAVSNGHATGEGSVIATG